MENATLSANGEALPKPELPRGDLEHRIDMERLATLSMEQLLALRDALHTLIEIACGMGSQPRFHEGGARDLVSDLIEWLNVYETAVVNVATAHQPTSERDANHQQWCLLGFHAAMKDSLDEFAVMAASAVHAEGKARFNEKHARRRQEAGQ